MLLQFALIEKKFTNLWYDFKLDVDKWTLRIDWPESKKDIMTNIVDESVIWRSIDQQTSINKLESNIKWIFNWIWAVYKVENRQRKNPQNEYITRTNSIIVSI